MALNISKGNMYPWITHTYNPMKGKCTHDCSYCYMKIYPQRELRLDEKELKCDLGKGNFIFVGSSTDDFAFNVPSEWIEKVLKHCWDYDNQYLFQTKNPARFIDFEFPRQTTLACTIETNRQYPQSISKAPFLNVRHGIMASLKGDFHKMISIEPIMDFDLLEFSDWIREFNPDFVSIGADSKNHHLPEPNADKIKTLISVLESYTSVIIKDNLKRLL